MEEKETRIGYPLIDNAIEDQIKQIAEAHWSYAKAIIQMHDDNSRYNEVEKEWITKALKLCEFHYVSAFVHGYKHGKIE